jgi:hypothetical protein
MRAGALLEGSLRSKVLGLRVITEIILLGKKSLLSYENAGELEIQIVGH